MAEDAPSAEGQADQPPKLYRKPRPLHLKDHAGLKLKTPRDYTVAAQMAMAPLNVGEFIHAAAHYPILFSNDKAPVPVAALGLAEGTNLFVGPDGAWRPGTYIPAYLQRYPFMVVRVSGEDAGQANGQENDEGGGKSAAKPPKGPNRLVLLVDEESPVLTDGEGEPLVVDGKPSKIARRAMKFCESFNRGMEETRAFSEALLGQGLFVRRDVKLALPGGGRVSMQGLNLIDPRKLREVADEVYLDWRRRGWVFALHAQLLSEHKWRDLGEMARNKR